MKFQYFVLENRIHNCHCFLCQFKRPSIFKIKKNSLLLSRDKKGDSFWCAVQYTAKTKYRNFETNIPRKGISGSQSHFPHSCVYECFIYFHDRSPILLEEICRPILGLYESLTGTWMWKLGLRPRYSQKRNTYVGFSLQCTKNKKLEAWRSLTAQPMYWYTASASGSVYRNNWSPIWCVKMRRSGGRD